MNINKFHEANGVYFHIKQEEERKRKLLNLIDEFTEIMKGYTQIPETELYELLGKIKGIGKYIDADIKRRYKQIEEL